ncbi:MAG: toll/interleukin-1 receptor domain-containing protein [Gammaproteobacteria bacterium]|nr:toll/interleukin-1 receptor domain-containing protein [Gammaproteobacteria bacterium]
MGDGIFISYRRADAAAMAGRIHDRLRARLPGRDVFVDVAGIVPGKDFEQRLQEALSQSRIVLVIVGERWLEKRAGALRTRIWDADDFVRYEIAWALAHGLTVIPILVDDAKMPGRDEVPPDVAPFVSRHAAEVRNSRFDDDLDHLLRVIEGRTDPQRQAGRRRFWPVAGGALTGLVVLLLALIAHREITGEPIASQLGLAGAIALVPIALFGGAFAGWRWASRRPVADVGERR